MNKYNCYQFIKVAMLNPTTPNIWMMTIGLELTNSPINLFNLGKYLEIQSVPITPIQVPVIVGIKYNQTGTSDCIIKGHYKVPTPKKIKKGTLNTPRNFNNQVSLQIQYLYHTINVKIFQNGNMHMSGIKDTSHSIIVRQLLVQELNNLHTQYSTIILKVENNVQYIDSDNFLYTCDHNNNFNVIGYKTRTPLQFCIHGRMYIYDVHNKHYYSTTMIRKKRVILSLDGTEIGYKKLVLNGINSRVYKNQKNINDTGDSLFIGNKLVGIYTIHLCDSSSSDIIENTQDVVSIKYCKRVLSQPISINDSPLDSVKIYNMFLKYNLGQRINKNILSSIFKQHGFTTRTLIDKSKVELTFKYNTNKQNNNSGCCTCNKDSTCTCTFINFVFFETGTVSVYGIKNTMDFIYIDQVNQIICSHWPL